MRDIKFRGKCEIGEDVIWVYGDLLQPTDLLDIYEISDCDSIDGSRYEVDRNTIGQYTGLKDKNGKEIYEGDIIQYEDIQKGVVEYSEQYAQFILKETGNIADEYEALGEFNIKVFKVIGNIYDNPELLEK